MSERQRLLDAIERAFNEVELGEGVSLHETVVIDNHRSTQERQATRLADERHDSRQADLATPNWAASGTLAVPASMTPPDSVSICPHTCRWP